MWKYLHFRNLSEIGAGELDGNVFTGHLGLDTLVGDDMVQGWLLPIQRLNSNTAWRLPSFELQHRNYLTAPVPWIGGADGSRLQVIAGYGVGGIELDLEGCEIEILVSNYVNFGASGYRELNSSDSLLFDGSSELTHEGVTCMARQFLSVSDVIDNVRTNARYLRLSTVGTHERELGNGMTVILQIHGSACGRQAWKFVTRYGFGSRNPDTILSGLIMSLSPTCFCRSTTEPNGKKREVEILLAGG